MKKYISILLNSQNEERRYEVICKTAILIIKFELYEIQCKISIKLTIYELPAVL